MCCAPWGGGSVWKGIAMGVGDAWGGGVYCGVDLEFDVLMDVNWERDERGLPVG